MMARRQHYVVLETPTLLSTGHNPMGRNLVGRKLPRLLPASTGPWSLGDAGGFGLQRAGQPHT